MKRFRLILPLAWRSLWRNPRRTFITMLVVCVGLWSILTFAVLFRAWAASSRDTTLKTMTGEVQIHASGWSDDPTAAHEMPTPHGALARLLASAAVKAYTTRVRVSAIIQSEYDTLPVTLAGVVPVEERRISTLPAQVTAGRYLLGADDDGIVLGRNLAKRLKTRVGKRVVVMAQDVRGKLAERAYPIVGLFGSSLETENAFAFTGLAPAQSLTSLGNGISEIALDSADDNAPSALIANLKRAAPGLDVQSWQTLDPLTYAVSTFFGEFVLMWLVMIIPLIAIGIVNTQMMAVFERTREFGLLGALGMRPRLLLVDVALESALLIGIGVLMGAALAFATAHAFHGGLDLGFLGRGAEMLGAGHILYPHTDPNDFVFYSLTVWLLGVIAALWPAWRASKVNPVEAMRHA